MLWCSFMWAISVWCSVISMSTIVVSSCYAMCARYIITMWWCITMSAVRVWWSIAMWARVCVPYISWASARTTWAWTRSTTTRATSVRMREYATGNYISTFLALGYFTSTRAFRTIIINITNVTSTTRASASIGINMCLHRTRTCHTTLSSGILNIASIQNHYNYYMW